jgi:transcriptional regulator with XRE-family HTH domain
MPVRLDTDELRIGTKLKDARLAGGLTLSVMARELSCSLSMLSKIENNQTIPSLPLLHKICRFLDISIGSLFDESNTDPVVIEHVGERPLIRLDSLRRGAGLSLERVIPYRPGHRLQCNFHHIEPKGASEGMITHEGEEVGYVLQGNLELTVSGRTYTLKAGDTFYFASDLPHGYKNVGPEIASVFWVNTPPTF